MLVVEALSPAVGVMTINSGFRGRQGRPRTGSQAQARTVPRDQRLALRPRHRRPPIRLLNAPSPRISSWWRSAFGIRHSAFGIRHSAFGIRAPAARLLPVVADRPAWAPLSSMMCKWAVWARRLCGRVFCIRMRFSLVLGTMNSCTCPHGRLQVECERWAMVFSTEPRR